MNVPFWQILEALHAPGGARSIPQGFVIANEPDISRCFNLAGNSNQHHQRDLQYKICSD